MQPRIYGLLLAMLLASGLAQAHQSSAEAERLPVIGPAPDFTLTTENGDKLSMADLQGKVVVVSFMFTSCPDVCPLLNAKMLAMQKELGAKFGIDVYFVSITVDPETDRPEVLKGYASALGYNPRGWAFLSGSVEEIRTTARGYGVFHEKRSDGNVDHNALTSLVDRKGILRVQYMGERFDPGEFLHDLRDLMKEKSAS